MTAARTFLLRLARDGAGATIVEFAILAPAVIGLMLGVLQVGMGMQSFNAIRNVTADTARYAVVEYQKGEAPDNARIAQEARDIASGAPYLMDSITVVAVDAATQQVDGAREITLTISYKVPFVLPLFNWSGPKVTHSRPIFVLD